MFNIFYLRIGYLVSPPAVLLVTLMGWPYFAFIYKKNYIYLFFVDHTCIMSITVSPNTFYRLERCGIRHMGPLAPVSLFKTHSLFSPHLKWRLTAHQWSSMILGTIIRFNQLFP